MKVIVDEKIPYIKGVIEQIAKEVVYAPGSAFTPQLVKDADALIVRTRTRCNAGLLKNSHVKFIATATIGYDHIDVEFCKQNGIAWANAPGCNANSVSEYIESCLLLLGEQYNLLFQQMTIGIVGVGNVGSKVAEMARRFGMTVLLNDPLRAEIEGNKSFSPIEELTDRCDIISFHTPLTYNGDYATLHLADECFFSSLKKRPILINTSRGEVINTNALLHAMEAETITDAIIDVWEHEPQPDHQLLQRAFVATPHIAGYSADGKANATQMALEALCRHFKMETSIHIEPFEPTILTDFVDARKMPIALLAYNPLTDSSKLKAHPERFEEFRNNYPLRREIAFYRNYLLKHFND